MKIAGLGRENLRLIEVDENFAMRPAALATQIKRDIAAQRIPFFVSATIGTTSSNAIDPVRAIGEICREHKIWLHVDAAMSGTAALCPEFRWIHDGVELADSYCFNPHKWMFTNFDCDCFYVADRKALINTMSVLPEYLRNQATESGAVIDYRDWHIPLGRRFRALKLWFVIRHYGIEGLQHHVRRHVELAQQFASWVRQPTGQLRTRRAGAAESRLLSPSRGRRHQPIHHGPPQSKRRSIPDAHEARRTNSRCASASAKPPLTCITSSAPGTGFAKRRLRRKLELPASAALFLASNSRAFSNTKTLHPIHGALRMLGCGCERHAWGE